MRVQVVGLVWCFLLAGCNNPPDGPSEPPTFEIFPQRQWSGGAVKITSAHFRDIDSFPAFLLGTDTAQPARLNDSTVELALPALSSGDYHLRVATADRTLEAGRIEIVGFQSARLTSPIFGSQYMIFRVHGRPIVLGGDGLRHLRSLDPSSGTVRDYRGYLLPSDYGPSPSFRGRDVVVLRDSNEIAGEYRLAATGLQLLDTVGTGFPFQFTRHLVPLRDDAYLITGSHQTVLYRGGQHASFTTESVWGVHFSPNSDQLVLASSVGLPGAQVFSTSLADTVFTLPLQSVYGIAWPLDGSRIYLSGGHQWDIHNHLAVVDAASGQVLAEDSLPPGPIEYWSLDVSRDGSHLFVLTEEDSTIAVGVYDGASLARLGSLTVPAGENRHCASCGWSGVLVLDEAVRKVYVVLPTGYQTVVYAFDVLVD